MEDFHYYLCRQLKGGGMEITMKKLKEFITRHMKASNALACMALAFAVIAANSPCCCVYHQPDKPNLKSLRKF